MPYLCNHCGCEISEINYNVNTTGSEYGYANLMSDEQVKAYMSRNNGALPVGEDIVDETNYDDCSNDWDGSPTYECRECDEPIVLSELIYKTPEEKEEEITVDELMNEDFEELNHKIITPKERIITNSERESTSNSMVCKNKKCFHVFVTETNRNYGSSTPEGFYECPRCGVVNECNEYRTLLAKGYFNLIRNENKPNKKSSKHRLIKSMVRRRNKLHT